MANTDYYPNKFNLPFHRSPSARGSDDGRSVRQVCVVQNEAPTKILLISQPCSPKSLLIRKVLLKIPGKHPMKTKLFKKTLCPQLFIFIIIN